MARKFCTSALIAALLFTPVAASAKDKPPQLSSLAIQAMQTKDFEGTKQQVFASVMSVLQDEGYRIQTGDIETGLITGIGSGAMKSNLFQSKKDTPIVSAFIEKLGNISRVRLNFVTSKVKTSIWTGQLLPGSEEPVLVQSVYNDAFEKIGKALFIRQSMDGEGSLPSSN